MKLKTTTPKTKVNPETKEEHHDHEEHDHPHEVHDHHYEQGDKQCCGNCKNGIEGNCNSIKNVLEKLIPEQKSKC